jgi:CheY-like chemotaxis protein
MDKPVILVVDDEANIRHLLRLAFEDDYQVIEAVDGQEALELARSGKPDIILSDIMMPNLDGYGLFRRLRSAPDTASIPFVFLSAKKDVDDRVAGLEMGADDYITKPFSIKELKAKIKSIARKFHDLRDRGSLEGLLSDVDLVDVIQLIEMSRKTGTLILEGGQEQGRIMFDEGQPVFAAADRWQGLEAFYTLLTWNEGSFRLEHQKEETEPNIRMRGGMEMLMEGVRCLDEMRSAAGRLPYSGTRLVVVPGKERPANLPDELLAAFEGGVTLEQAQARVPIPPYKFVPMVADAWQSGLLAVPAAGSDKVNIINKFREYLAKL